jgi:4-hydroxy-3-polyprenylbenzoate decarboxylase
MPCSEVEQMNESTPPPRETAAWTRRDLLGTGLALGALAGSTGSRAAGHKGSGAKVPTAPFDSLREYLAALEARGLVMRIPQLDQDAYEAAALMYRIRDQHGMRGGPALLIEEVRIGGRWLKGPLIINESGNLHAECLIFGLEPVTGDPVIRPSYASYRKARDHVIEMLRANGGEYPAIEPVAVTRAEAPCKEIVREGDDIDLTQFPFIQCNPADAGRYINTGVVFTRHPQQGLNIGTYRCHLRGPREIGLNSEPGQTGYRQLMAMREAGEEIAPVSIALSPDPYVWILSSNKLASRRRGSGPVNELAIAGGLAGRPLQVVRSETNDFLVPATAEMIIEGEVPLQDMRAEGPYGEMVGYQGMRKAQQFWMRVTRVTHRREPWIMNNFTGLQAGSLMAAGHARPFMELQQQIPEVVDFYADGRAVGCTFVSIRKTKPGQGLEIAKQIAATRFNSKVVVVVDDDLDVTNQEQMLAALGARWQPDGNTHVFAAQRGLPLDPSAPQRGRTSKIAIDATRQWPEEGGPDNFPALNRTLLEQGAPEAFARVDAKWGKAVRDWRPG